MTLTVGSLFSGIGGLDLAVEALTGGRVAWHSEIEPGPAKVLEQHWPGIPNLGDITAIDWHAVEPVDVLCGGFPCQDISTAGRGAGIKEGTRSGLWYRYADAVRVLRPRYVFVENVGALLVRGLGTVLGDLASLGYVGSWCCLRASDVGAPHQRNRVFLLARDASDANGDGLGWLKGLPGGRDEVPHNLRVDVDERGAGRVGSSAVADRVGPLLPTPTTQPSTGNGHARNLGGEVRSLLSTPRTSDTNGAGVHGNGGLDLRTAVTLLPTPRTSTAKGSSAAAVAEARRTGVDEASRLEVSVEAFTDATDWGPYEPAIRRWEALTRPAPSPVDERGRLNPDLPEWMMGFDAGWITDHLPRTAALKAAGNAVCPQQATAAFGLLIGEKP